MQNNVAEQTARIRRRRGQSLRKFAVDCGCSHTAIDKIERGLFVPCDDLAVTIAALGGMLPGQMLFYARCDRAEWGIRERVSY